MKPFLLVGFFASVTLFADAAKAQNAPRSPVPVPPMPSNLPPGKAAPQGTDIWAIFKTHCDLGYPMSAEAVNTKYRESMMEHAVQLIEADRARPVNQRFKWTLPGLMSSTSVACAVEVANPVPHASVAAISQTVSAPKPGDADFPTPCPSARHNEKVKAVRTGTYDLVLIGDSITHTLQNFGGKYQPLTPAVWDKYYATRNAINLGYSGYRTEQILWHLQNGELDFKTSPKLFMLLIGTNNADAQHFRKMHTPGEIFAGTKAIVDTIRQKHPASKILLMRIFPKGLHSQKNEGTSPPLFSFSPAEVDTSRRAGELTAKLADNQNVFWMDINHLFLRPDGTINPALLWDLLHPNAAGAEAWAQAVDPMISLLMGVKPIAPPLTNPAVIPVPRTDGGYDWRARHEAVLKARDTNPQIVFIGDSITHHMGGIPAPTGPFLSHRGDEFWNAICRQVGGPGLNLGFGADWTQHALWRLDHGELDGLAPKFVVLTIGTNNVLWGDTNADQIVEGVRACVLRIRAKVPNAKLILTGVPPCRNPATHPNRLLAAKVNEGLKRLAEEAKVSFLDLTPKLLDAAGNIPKTLMDDAVHPTAEGYKIWQEALSPLLVTEQEKPAKACVAATPAKHVWPGHPWWPGRFAEKCKLAEDGGFDVMFIGDSITHGIDSNGDEGLFKKMLAPAVIGNFGDAGDTTENVLWRLDNGQLNGKLNPKVVMVMIGTNNTRCRMDPPEEIAAGVEAVVTRLTTRFPKTQVLLLGIFPFGHSPQDATRVNNGKTNALLAKLNGTAEGRVHFLDITDKFLDADGNLPASVMPDFLHPNAAGYKIWAEAVVPEIKKWLAR